jgi:hypothetical protein
MFTHVWPFGVLVIVAIAGVIIANQIDASVERSHPEATEEQKVMRAKALAGVVGVLFMLLCASVIPLFLRAFTFLQGKIGNADLAMVVFIRAHECMITYIVWGVLAVASMFIVPDMMREAGTG